MRQVLVSPSSNKQMKDGLVHCRSCQQGCGKVVSCFQLCISLDLRSLWTSVPPYVPRRRTCGRLQGVKVSDMRLHLDSLDSAEQFKDWISQSFSKMSQKGVWLGKMMPVPKRSGYGFSMLVLKLGCPCSEASEEKLRLTLLCVHPQPCPVILS